MERWNEIRRERCAVLNDMGEEEKNKPTPAAVVWTALPKVSAELFGSTFWHYFSIPHRWEAGFPLAAHSQREPSRGDNDPAVLSKAPSRGMQTHPLHVHASWFQDFSEWKCANEFRVGAKSCLFMKDFSFWPDFQKLLFFLPSALFSQLVS